MKKLPLFWPNKSSVLLQAVAFFLIATFFILQSPVFFNLLTIAQSAGAPGGNAHGTSGDGGIGGINGGAGLVGGGASGGNGGSAGGGLGGNGGNRSGGGGGGSSITGVGGDGGNGGSSIGGGAANGGGGGGGGSSVSPLGAGGVGGRGGDAVGTGLNSDSHGGDGGSGGEARAGGAGGRGGDARYGNGANDAQAIAGDGGPGGKGLGTGGVGGSGGRGGNAAMGDGADSDAFGGRGGRGGDGINNAAGGAGGRGGDANVTDTHIENRARGGRGGDGGNACGGLGQTGGQTNETSKISLGAAGGAGGPACSPPAASCDAVNGLVTWTWGIVAGNANARLRVYDIATGNLLYDSNVSVSRPHTTALNSTNMEGQISYGGSPIFSTRTNITCTLPGFSISGSVFEDINKNGVKDVGESNYTASSSTITLSGPSSSSITTASGDYSFTGLPAGNYNVSYNSLPAGYKMTAPLNGPPPSRNITVGPSSSNANFGITNSFPWIQGYNLDMRLDGGFTNPIPATSSLPYASAIYSAATATTPGIVFSGDTNPDFGGGSASTRDWQVGNATYPEVYSSTGKPLSVSYQSLLAKGTRAGLTINTLNPSTCGGGEIGNCSLNPNLPKGVYRANGNLNLNGYTFPPGRNYVFLIDGTLTIKDDIVVPDTSTVIFSAKNDIVINNTVGAPPIAPPPSTGQIQGFFAAGEDFRILGNSTNCSPADEMLNIDGAVIANAQGAGGDFLNERDLCAANLTAPSVTIKARMDLILNAPSFLGKQSIISREETP